ncbi:MAG: M20/M25/M40 family metallo-hydrolase [Pseudomonadota bacterium]
MAGAELVTTLERSWHQIEASDGDLVLTFGEFATDPAQHGITKVPGRVDFTLDMRSQDPGLLEQFDADLQAKCTEIATKRGVQINLGSKTRAAPAPMDDTVQSSLAASARRCKVDYMSLPSGGGHDCATFAGLGVPSGMLFIRNENGSHNPNEDMELEDFHRAARVLTKWAQSLLETS